MENTGNLCVKYGSDICDIDHLGQMWAITLALLITVGCAAS